MTGNQPTAHEAFTMHAELAAAKLKKLEAALAVRANVAADDPYSWRHAADMARIDDILESALIFLGVQP